MQVGVPHLEINMVAMKYTINKAYRAIDIVGIFFRNYFDNTLKLFSYVMKCWFCDIEDVNRGDLGGHNFDL